MVSKSPYNASLGGTKTLKSTPQPMSAKPRSPYVPCKMQIQSSPFRPQTLTRIGIALREGKAAANKIVPGKEKDITTELYKVAQRLYNILHESEKLEESIKLKGWDALIGLKALDQDKYRKFVSNECK